MTGIKPCGGILMTPEYVANRARVQDIIDIWNKSTKTKNIYGSIDTINDNTPATSWIKKLVKKVDPTLSLDDTFMLNDGQKNRIIGEIKRSDDMLGKQFGYLRSLIKIPVSTMRKTIVGDSFYKELDRAKNHERNHTVFQAQKMKNINKAFRDAYLAEGLNVGIFSIDAFKRISRLESEARRTGDKSKRAELDQKIEEIWASDDGALIRDFNYLMTIPDAIYADFIADGVTDKPGESIEAQSGRLHKPYNPSILEGVGYAREYLKEMGTVNKNALFKMRDAVWVKYTGATYSQNKQAAVYKPELKRLNKSVEDAVLRINRGLKDGGYFPNIVIEDIMNLKNKFNEMLNEDSAANMSKFITETARDMDTMLKTDPPANIKAKNDIVQRNFVRNPLFILQQYGSEAIQFNKLNTIATEYQKVLHVINHPEIKAGGAKYMEGLAEFLHDEYTIATKGLANRPEWINNTVRALKVFETMKAMGLGITGPIRNAASAHFFFTQMGLSGIRKAYSALDSGLIQHKDNAKTITLKSLVQAVEIEQGFGFKDIGNELAAEGLLPRETYEKLDFRFNHESGQLEVKDKGDPNWQIASNLKDKALSASLIGHRVTENFIRKWMFRMGFAESISALQKQTPYWQKFGGDNITLGNWRSNKLVREAVNTALFAVNRFAGEYAMHAKSRILTGHPGKVNVNRELLNKTEVGITSATSLATGLLHYPMFFLDMQAQQIKGGAYAAMARQWDAPELKYMANYAAVFAFIQLMSVMGGYNLNNIFDNDTLSKGQQIYRNVQGPEPEDLNPDGTLKDNAKGLYGVAGEFTGPIVDDLAFAMMASGILSMPDSELSRIAWGYDRYLESTDPAAKERAFWQRTGTFSGFMMNKAIPAWQEGRTMDIARHAFALYPSDWIKDSRAWIGTDKELLGLKIPGIKVAPFKPKKKSSVVSGINYFANKANKSNRKKYSNIKRSPLEQLQYDLESANKRRNMTANIQPFGTTR